MNELNTHLQEEVVKLRKERLRYISEKYPEFYERIFGTIKLETVIAGEKEAIKMYNFIVGVYFSDRPDRYEGITWCSMN